MKPWPNGARGAVAFTFDFDAEEVWIGDDPENANRPRVPRRGGGHAEQLVGLTSAGRAGLYLPPAAAAGGGTRAWSARRQRCQGQDTPGAQAPPPRDH